MSKPIIIVKNISKKYKIGVKQSYNTLRDTLMDKVRKPVFLRFPKKKTRETDEIWALKNISFSVNKGEILGIIGGNGAGKSTLLKILSRITPPTDGEIVMRGRVASLLEVGTGFNAELTGRENIFLNGAIIGMTQKEIKREFDNIVEFSGIEKFIDTPVKKYSSGMYMRLAFAIAAHLHPEILLIDEVLAVGDIQFQRKCLGKMDEVAKLGRTVLFVSHNMLAVKKLCSKTILLDKGTITKFGQTESVVNTYLENMSANLDLEFTERKDSVGKGKIRVLNAVLNGCRRNKIYSRGKDIKITVTVENNYDFDKKVRLMLGIYSQDQQLITSCDSFFENRIYTLPAKSTHNIVCQIVSPALNYGIYDANFAILDGEEIEVWYGPLIRFTIETHNIGNNYFPLVSDFRWKVDRLNTSI